MHMQSRKDLNSSKLDTVRVSRNSTTVVTANGEVQTNEEATVCVYDLDLLENTMQHGKLCSNRCPRIINRLF